MRIIADLHTHTMVSSHALSSLDENLAAARAMGLLAVAVTNHAPGLPDSAHIWHFRMLCNLPERVGGVRLIRGAEVNIMDTAGALDMPESDMARLEFVIASMHQPCLKPGTPREHTDIWLRMAENPLVDCLGHPGQPEYDFDHRAVVAACRDTDTLIEINNNSAAARPGSRGPCMDIAALCAEMGVGVVVNSDAHWAGHVGEVGDAMGILEEIGFPGDLVINAEYGRLAAWFERKRGVSLCTSE